MKACMNVYKPFNEVIKKYTALYAETMEVNI